MLYTVLFKRGKGQNKQNDTNEGVQTPMDHKTVKSLCSLSLRIVVELLVASK